MGADSLAAELARCEALTRGCDTPLAIAGAVDGPGGIHGKIDRAVFVAIFCFGEGRTAATIDSFISYRQAQERATAVGDVAMNVPHGASLTDERAGFPVDVIAEKAHTPQPIFGRIGGGAADSGEVRTAARCKHYSDYRTR